MPPQESLFSRLKAVELELQRTEAQESEARRNNHKVHRREYLGQTQAHCLDSKRMGM
jgi:hypothetical protein